MKKILLIVVIAVVTLLACREKQNIIPSAIVQPEDSSVVNDTTIFEDSSYVIFGITDYSIKSLESKSIPLEVMLTGKSQDKITLSVVDLPDYTTAEFEPESGYTGFNTLLTINTMFVKPGIYPIVIKGTSGKNLTKSYKVNLSVEGVPCDSILVYRTNHFRTRSVWNQYILYGNTHMDVDYKDPELFYFSSLLVGMDGGNPIITYEDIRYFVNCDSFTISIPATTVLGTNQRTGQTNTFIVEGSGTINPDERKVIINYSSKDEQGVPYRYEMYADITL